ncbi:MAG: group III truncated hemoglobin [Bacteroidota bacterium]
MEKRDIQDREDIAQLLASFYEKMLKDELMKPIFIDLANIDLNKHLPILCDFWENVLFQSGNYQRNAMKFHLEIHLQHPLEEKHFGRWLSHFEETLQESFEGPKARQALERAHSIAGIMQLRIQRLDEQGRKYEAGS